MQEALKEYEILAVGIQQHPLIKGSVNKVKKSEATSSNSSKPKPAPLFKKKTDSGQSPAPKKKFLPLFKNLKKKKSE